MPIIFLNAHEDKQARAKAMAVGAVAFMRKPFKDHFLLDAIHPGQAANSKCKGVICVQE